jgi:hypothetical protein
MNMGPKKRRGDVWMKRVDNVNHYALINASVLEFTHAEHQKVIHEVPNGHYALISGQRGRTEGLLSRTMRGGD